MELAARNARHLFFRDCARTQRCNRVLLAHHADDQAETILFNLLRGSAGLKGMAYHSRHSVDGKQLEFFRPMLGVTRAQIDSYLTQHQIQYREDTSNAEPVATRNRLRNEAIPLLEEIMGREIRPSLLRAEKLSSRQSQSIKEIIDAYQLEDPQGRLFLPKLERLAPATQTTAIHMYLKKNGLATWKFRMYREDTPNIVDISGDVLDRCRSLINDRSIAKVNLPGGKYFRRRAKRLFID